MSGFRPFPDQPSDGHEAELSRPERLAALRETGLLDSLPDAAYDRAIRLARQITGAKVGLLALVDDKRQFFKAQQGLTGPAAEARGTPLSHSFCQYVVTEGATLAVEDARDHPLLAGNGAVRDLGVVAYLGVPVRDPRGEVLGSFCAISDEPHAWTADEVAAVQDLARTVETEIRLHRALDERALIIDELNHRVKNLFAVVSSMIRLSAREAADAAELGRTLLARMQALALGHDLIAPATRRGVSSGARVGLAELTALLIAPYQSAGKVRIEGPELLLGARATTSLALALHELATNAAKHGVLGAESGTLSITWTLAEDQLEIDWQESGRAVPEAEAHTGFGSRLLQISIGHQLGGEIESGRTDQGIRHRIRLPRPVLAT